MECLDYGNFPPGMTNGNYDYIKCISGGIWMEEGPNYGTCQPCPSTHYIVSTKHTCLKCKLPCKTCLN